MLKLKERFLKSFLCQGSVYTFRDIDAFIKEVTIHFSLATGRS